MRRRALPYNPAMVRPYTTTGAAGDRRLGRRFRYPECCITYFVNTWQHLANDERRALPRRHVGYIECPRCVDAEFTPTSVRHGYYWRFAIRHSQPMVLPRAVAARTASAP